MSYLPDFDAIRLLVVEGDPGTMDRLSGILETAGYNVHRATNADDALYLLDHGRFDLALIDARMGDSHNRALVDLLADFPWVRWIALVDDRYARPESLVERGAVAWLPQTAKPTLLLRQVEAAMNGEPAPPAGAAASPDDRARDEFSALLERRLI
ncbi:MAG: response regulator transcription factor, partial [Chloroflexi bacterium]|nr:response regulator transcription factor [Chloroflexota bacterium]